MLRFHLNYQDAGRDDMRALIDAWWPMIESGEIEAIVMSASGRGSTVQEYGHYLAADPAYAEKAARVSAITMDLAEVVAAEGGNLAFATMARAERVAFHSPCSLQHGENVRGAVEQLLTRAGYDLAPVPDQHSCCGSAGTYSILQSQLSKRLRDLKLAALESGRPTRIATANIGCLSHLGGGTSTPVKHWVQLLEERLA